MMRELCDEYRRLLTHTEAAYLVPLRVEGSEGARRSVRIEAHAEIDAILAGIDRDEADGLRGLARSLVEAELWREYLASLGVAVTT